MALDISNSGSVYPARTGGLLGLFDASNPINSPFGSLVRHNNTAGKQTFRRGGPGAMPGGVSSEYDPNNKPGSTNAMSIHVSLKCSPLACGWHHVWKETIGEAIFSVLQTESGIAKDTSRAGAHLLTVQQMNYSLLITTNPDAGNAVLDGADATFASHYGGDSERMIKQLMSYVGVSHTAAVSGNSHFSLRTSDMSFVNTSLRAGRSIEECTTISCYPSGYCSSRCYWETNVQGARLYWMLLPLRMSANRSLTSQRRLVMNENARNEGRPYLGASKENLNKDKTSASDIAWQWVPAWQVFSMEEVKRHMPPGMEDDHILPDVKLAFEAGKGTELRSTIVTISSAHMQMYRSALVVNGGAGGWDGQFAILAGIMRQGPAHGAPSTTATSCAPFDVRRSGDLPLAFIDAIAWKGIDYSVRLYAGGGVSDVGGLGTSPAGDNGIVVARVSAPTSATGVQQQQQQQQKTSKGVKSGSSAKRSNKAKGTAAAAPAEASGSHGPANEWEFGE